MEKVIMKATIREKMGKNVCKHLRDKGLIPGIVYKGGKEGLAICVNAKDLWKSLQTEAGENVIITLDIEGAGKGSNKTVMMQELQRDAVSDRIVHVDFHEISLTEIIRVKVPITLKGEAAGIKEGGVLSQVLWEVEVECKAMDVPRNIDVIVDSLKMNEALHVKDLVLPAEVKVTMDPEQVVAAVNPPYAEEVVAAPEAAEAAGVTAPEEPEVIKKGKKEEEEIAEEEGAAKKEAPAKKEGAPKKE